MLKSESLPSGFVYVEKGSSIFYHYIKSSNQPIGFTETSWYNYYYPQA